MKKRISLMIAVVMIMTHLLSIVSFADFSDVKDDNPYRQAIITLTKLGVINGYEEEDKTFTFRPEGEITRAEFTKMLITALGRGDYTTEPTEFSDIDGHWARYNIKTAYDMKIINGFDDGTFRPDEQVTYEQALKMVVCTLGYIDFAESKGGWPNGYTSQAAELRLTKGITGQKNSEPALRQVIAQVVYNALEVKKMEKNIKGEYELTDKTILNDDLKVYKLEGEIVGVEGIKTDDCTVSLLDYQMAVKAGNDEHVIDVRDYKELSVAGLQQYVGKQAVVYYALDKASDVKTLVILDAETVKNTTYEISYEDIVSFNGTELKYYEKDAIRAKTIKLDLNNVTAVYNGETLNATDTYELCGKDATASSAPMGKIDAVKELLNPTSEHFIYGDVELTDSGSDGTIDMVIINDYRWMIAYRSVSSADYKVQNSLVTKDTLILDPENIREKIYVEKNGKEVEPTAISSGDVLTYTESFDGKIKRVFVSKETVTGEVNSLSTDKITINNKEYNLDKNCVQYMKNKGYTLSTGKNVTMYLDKMGTVVYGTVKAEAAIPYGYIADVNYYSSEDTTYVKAFVPSVSATKLSNLKLSETAKINGIKVNGSNEATTLLNVSAADVNEKYNPDTTAGIPNYTPSGTNYSQVARIKVESGEITEIITLDTAAALQSNTDVSKIVRSKELEQYKVKGTTFKLGNSTAFTINSSTVIIDVPADRINEREASGGSSANKYVRRTSESFSNIDDETFWAEAYDLNSSRVAGLVIRYNISDSDDLIKMNKKSNHSLVGGIISQGSDDGETLVSKIPLYDASETATPWTIKNTEVSDFSPPNLEVGDIIQYDYNSDKQIQNKKYVLKYSDIKSVLNAGALVKEGAPISGKVYNWLEEQPQDSNNRWQKYKFDFRFPYDNPSNLNNYYETANTSSGVYSRATMFNVLRVLPDENAIIVTRDGFDTADITEAYVDNISDFEKITLPSSVKMLKLAQNGASFVSVDDEGKDLNIESLKEAVSDGLNCSKIMVSTISGSIKLVVIYE